MVHSAKMGGALKILERMVNQNAEDEIFQDFKYWEVGHEQCLECAHRARYLGTADHFVVSRQRQAQKDGGRLVRPSILLPGVSALLCLLRVIIQQL